MALKVSNKDRKKSKISIETVEANLEVQPSTCSVVESPSFLPLSHKVVLIGILVVLIAIIL